MRAQSRRRKCRCCKQFFIPDFRNHRHQLYCSDPECRKASKAASQRRWLEHPGNRDYFRGPDQVQRVQRWRQAHPDYWKRSYSRSQKSQDVDPQADNPVQSSCNATPVPSAPLQEVCMSQDPLFVGLISLLTGSTLQEDIVNTSRRLFDRGRNILGGQEACRQSHSLTP